MSRRDPENLRVPILRDFTREELFRLIASLRVKREDGKPYPVNTCKDDLIDALALEGRRLRRAAATSAAEEAIDWTDPDNLRKPILEDLTREGLFRLIASLHVTRDDEKSYPQSTCKDDLVRALAKEGRKLRRAAEAQAEDAAERQRAHEARLAAERRRERQAQEDRLRRAHEARMAEERARVERAERQAEQQRREARQHQAEEEQRRRAHEAEQRREAERERRAEDQRRAAAPMNIMVLAFEVLRRACDYFSEPLGSGSFGDVFAGTLRGSDLGSSLREIPVAVKKLSEESEQGMTEVLAEVNLLSRLRHSNIVPILACSLEPRRICIVYPRMRGSLHDKFANLNERASMQWEQRVQILADVASGLAYLHEQTPAVIHRDVKPANILLDGDNCARLSDFGIARARRGDGTSSRTSVAGTENYIDPLYIRDGRLLTALDVYSLGLIAMQLLTDSITTLDLPEQVTDAVSELRVASILSDSCTWPTDVSYSLARFLIKCTSLVRADRPSASQLAELARSLLVRGRPSASRPTPPRSTPECRICMDRPRAIQFRPCGHFVCCERCSRLLCARRPARCCICAAEITSAIPFQGTSTFTAR